MKVYRDGSLTTDVKRCARCGGNHKQLTFTVLDRPAGASTHWAPCPFNHQPILLRVEADAPPKRKAAK